MLISCQRSVIRDLRAIESYTGVFWVDGIRRELVLSRQFISINSTRETGRFFSRGDLIDGIGIM